MGQLEKYGLYVLCLVIFLILGVAIWGGDAAPVHAGNSPLAGNVAAPPGGNPAPAIKREGAPRLDASKGFESLLADVATPKAPSGDKPAGDKLAGDKKGDDKKVADKKPDDKKAEPAKHESPPAADTAHRQHKVLEHETFESIAEKELGHKSLAQAIARLNPKVEPTKMKIGTVLDLPSKAETQKLLADAGGKKEEPKKGSDKPDAAKTGKRVYTVQKGDTFDAIAFKQLGSHARTSELLELNPGIEPTKLKDGMEIKLPAK